MSRKDTYSYRSSMAQSSIAEIMRKRQKDGGRREERDRSIENHASHFCLCA